MDLSSTDRGMRIGPEFLPLYSGAFHYWRVDRSRWRGILRQIRGMGFDFGDGDEGKDLGAFLSLCEEEGLRAIVRPGPHINAELSLFGYPDRIVYDPEIQARSPWGTPVMLNIALKQFPLPSYASEKLFAEVEVLFAALAPILKHHAAPRGSVCALQIDNETCYFFKDQAYAMDYCPDAVAQYRRMLAAKYGEVARLNEAYRSSFRDFAEVSPPGGYRASGPEDLPFYLDWAEYKEHQILEALRRLKGISASLGVDLPTFQNVQSQNYTPVDLAAMEDSCVDVAGIDMYPEPRTFRLVRDRVRYMCGTSRFPFIPEFGCGSWYERRKTLSPAEDEEEFVTLYAFMNGVRGINYYMLVERDRWQGSPITVDGRAREEYFALYASINGFLKRNRLWNFRRESRVLLVKNYEKWRFDSIYSHYDFGELSCNEVVKLPDPPWKLMVPSEKPPFPDLAQASYGSDDQIEYGTNLWGKESLLQEAAAALSAAGVDYDISDTHVPADRLARYDLVICCTYDFMSPSEARKLVSCARSGAQVLVGPVAPSLDREMRPCDLLAEELASPGTSMRLMSKAEDAVAAAMPCRGKYRAAAPGVELVLQSDGRREILFAANVSASEARFAIDGLGESRLDVLWGGAAGAAADPSRVSMPGYSVCAWEVLMP